MQRDNKLFRTGILVAGVFAVLALAGCAGPVALAGGTTLPPSTTNTVTVAINPSTARSGLISVGTASARADVYDVILYNASNVYRIVVSSNATAALMTNIVPSTYGVLVLAGKSNGAAQFYGKSAAVVLGSGDIPYLPAGHNPATVTGVASALDGRGVVVAATGNTAVSVTLQNLVYSISSSVMGAASSTANPFTAGVTNSFTVTHSYDLFLNLTSATNANSLESPLEYINLGSLPHTKVTGATPTYITTSVTGNAIAATFHPLAITTTFTAPATSGTSVISLDTAGVASGQPGRDGIGEVRFYNSVLNSGGAVSFSTLTPQSGTAYNWYLPSDSLTVAMPAITDSVTNAAVPGSVTVNFSAPGVATTIGWGAGR
jgi:hypothetical protein